jgi:single-stranded DNA-binding protein
LKTETWKDKEGIEKSRLKVRVQNFTLLGGTKNTNEGGAPMPPQNNNQPNNTGAPTPTDSLSDDLPF